MSPQISQKNRVRNGLRTKLRFKVAIALTATFIVAGIVTLIVLNTGPSKKSEAEITGQNGPTSNNAYFDAGPYSYINFGPGRDIDCIKKLSTKKELTITLWVKWEDKTSTDVGPRAALFTLCDSTGNSNNGVFWVQHNEDNSAFEFVLKTVNDGQDTVRSVTRPVNGVWYHIACVYNGNSDAMQLKIYIDGVLESITPNLHGNIENVSYLARMSLGRNCNPARGYRHFKGYIDEVSLWNVALSGSEISGMINDPTTVLGNSYNASGLLSYWNFDDLTATGHGSCNIDGVVGAGTTLPVELITFTGSKSGNKIDLEWITASEHNNDHFSIERSLDMQNYESIGTIYGAGESNYPIRYNFTDESPGNSYNYYRLRQVDYDGSFEFSNALVVNMGETTSELIKLKAGPNPFTNKIFLYYTATESGAAEITMYNLSGNAVKQESTTVTTGDNTLLLAVNSELASGFYLVGINQDRRKTELVKLFKSN